MNMHFSALLSDVNLPDLSAFIGPIPRDTRTIFLSGANPSVNTYPAKAIAEITAQAYDEHADKILHYAPPAGYPPLITAVQAHLLSFWQLSGHDNQLMICSGAQQAVDLIAKALLDPGDVVLHDELSYTRALSACKSYGARLVDVPMESDGMSIEHLERALSDNPETKIIYLIPTFHSPTGITLCAEKRKAIYELAERYNVFILEDSPLSELRFAGEHIPPIKQLDVAGRVIYVGSFSKILTPAFRLGYVLASQALVQKLVIAKQLTDMHANLLYQYVCHRLMTDSRYDFLGHLAFLQAYYKARCDSMMTAIAASFHPAVTYNIPAGGLGFTAHLPPPCDALGFCRQALQRGVILMPGASFMMEQNKTSGAFRLSFSVDDMDEITEGIGIVGKLTYDYLSG